MTNGVDTNKNGEITSRGRPGGGAFNRRKSKFRNAQKAAT